MAFARFAKTATTTPTAAASEPEVLTPATVTTAAAAIPASAPAANPFRGLATLKTHVLAAIAAKADEKPAFVEPFPHLTLKGGNAGGQIIPSNATAANFPDIAAQLPQGKQPLVGVLVHMRAEAVSWPCDYDSAPEDCRPVINCAIPLSDADGMTALLAGCENFQFASRETKAEKWAATNGGPGYLRPVFQMLIWLPSIKECVVVQLSPLLRSFQEMAKQMQSVTDEKTGEPQPWPIKLVATSAPWYGDNMFHYFGITVDTKGKAIYEEYQAWIQDVVANRPDVAASVTEWINGEDKPMSDADIEKLTRAANMVNARRGRGAKS